MWKSTQVEKVHKLKKYTSWESIQVEKVHKLKKYTRCQSTQDVKVATDLFSSNPNANHEPVFILTIIYFSII